ncbi:MAG: DUF1295 domain-containing protein [Crocinitomicaceae bacterium]
MIDKNYFDIFAWIWIAVAVITFISLFFITAPYGRHTQEKGWGKLIDNRWGWFFMEIPSFALILVFTTIGDLSNYALMLAGIWLIHYFNRTFIFPMRLRTTGKKMPLSIVLSAIFFNGINAGMNGYFLAYFETYSDADFLTPFFIVGITLFIGGAVINNISDHILIHLRKPGETGYKIPTGFMYKYISCPNFFGEMTQWIGFAIMACNLPALTFCVWTIANVFPRAIKHHSWYKEKFADYPKERKAVIPFIR